MIRTLFTKAEKENNKLLLEAINDLKRDANKLPKETEEWTGSVDKGGLWYVIDAAHQFDRIFTKVIPSCNQCTFNGQ